MAIQLTAEIEPSLVTLKLDGRELRIVRESKGRVRSLSLEGIHPDEQEKVFGAAFASELLRMFDNVLSGLEILHEQTGRTDVWAEMPEELADEVYDFLG